MRNEVSVGGEIADGGLLAHPLAAVPDVALVTGDGVCVGVRLAVQAGGRFLVLRRAATDSQPGRYEFPGGGVAEGEALEAAALRELDEESGIVLAGLGLPGFAFGFQTPRSGRMVVTHLYTRELATPPSVCLNPAEHDAYTWVTPGEAMRSLALTSTTQLAFVLLQDGGVWLAVNLSVVPLGTLAALAKRGDGPATGRVAGDRGISVGMEE